MITVNSGNLWDELEKLAKQTKSLSAAVAYVSDDSIISFKKGDLLVVDASNNSIESGRTSAKVLHAAYNNGAKLYSCDTLHGKVIVFDNYAYIGSANISNNSKVHLDEVGVISDYPNIISGAIQFIEKLINISVKIDERYIDVISKIKIKPPQPSSPSHGNNIKIKNPCTWILSTVNDIEYPGDEEKVKKDQESFEIVEN